MPPTPNPHVEVLITSTSECDCIWRQAFKEVIRLYEVIGVGSVSILLVS